MEKIKLIAMDIGGTLLTDNNQISNETIKIITKIKSMGIDVALITARMYSSTKYISKVIDADYGIFGNGSVVMDLKDKKALYFEYLDSNDVEELIIFSKDEQVYMHISRLLWEVSDENKYFALKHKILNKTYPKELKSNVLVVDDLLTYCKKHSDIVKAIFVSEDNMDSFVEKFKNKFPDLYITEYNQNLFEHAINKTINYVEIGRGIKNKADGLKNLINHLGILPDEVLVIGDGKNDIEMFKNFKNSGCPSNGDEEIKKQANYVSNKTNNQSAVVDIIQNFIKEGKINYE